MLCFNNVTNHTNIVFNISYETLKLLKDNHPGCILYALSAGLDILLSQMHDWHAHGFLKSGYVCMCLFAHHEVINN